MKIEEGKYYRTRDGRKVGPVKIRASEWVCDQKIDTYSPMWNRETGVANFTTYGPESDAPQYDLIAEWTDEPDTPKLWRDMTPEEKGALLLAHHEGPGVDCHDGHEWFYADTPVWDADTAYRVRPEPVRHFHEIMHVRDNGHRGNTYYSITLSKLTHEDCARLSADIAKACYESGLYRGAAQETVRPWWKFWA